ncbi:TonB-dependent receptor family protein [Methylophaga sulfidovorans]|uniref:Iron complex outermembrane recepter protein n=1 Tax=Methylophaga sulfidovorans TaxID=45496 RepID=A0A1I4C1J2_9GAMM|nr:TonB-dependent receptor [Methylophaga sulfidovorans]SFK74643.1 iron complex outermembrane recepter protein [Methylophaga sulfidovorans]
MDRQNFLFKTLTSLLALAGLVPFSVHAEHGALQLENVKVTADAVAPGNIGIETDKQEIRQTPGGVSIIDMDQLTEGQVDNLQDAFRFVPGVWAVSPTGSDSIFLSSRGSNLDATDYDTNGVKLLQDGLSVSGADGNNHNRFIDPLSAKYAVFARGANAMKYGASTLGGAVNFISQTAYDVSPLTLSFSGGSHGERLTRMTAAQVFNDTADALVTIENTESDGFRDHSRHTRTGLYANGGLRLSDDVSTRFYFTKLDSDEELAGGLTRAQVHEDRFQAGSSNRRDVGHFQLDVDTWRIANKTIWEIDNNRSLEFGVSYEEQELRHPIVVFGPPSLGNGLLINNRQRNLSTMMRYHHKVGNHDWLAGVNYGVTWVDGGNYNHLSGSKRDKWQTNDNDANTLELVLLDRWNFAQDWTLVAGAQTVRASREVRSTTLASSAVRQVEDDYHHINPRVGLIYQLNQEISLYTNLSSLYEPPTTYQLDDGTSTDALKAMQGEVFEVGSRGHQPLTEKSEWGWDVSAYYAQLDNEILSVEDPSQPGQFFTSNADKTIHAGIEALLSADIALTDDRHHRLTPLVSMTWNHFRFDDDDALGDNTLPAAPKFAMHGEMLYRHKNGFYFGPTMDYVGERYADFANTYKIDSYTLFGLKSGWSNEKFKVFAEVRNLFERDYIASHSVRAVASESDAILNPGAPLSAYAGIEYRY